MREYLVALRSTDAAGVLYVNTFAIKSDPQGPDIQEISDQQVADGVKAWVHDSYKALLSTDYTWNDVQVTGILGHDGEALSAVGESGSFPREPGGSFQLPREVVLTLTLKTAHVGRSGRGHMALPSPDDAAQLQNNSTWKVGAGTFHEKCQAFGNALVAGHDVDIDPLLSHLSVRVYSRKDAVTRDVTAAVARTPIRWLRSRSTSP